jgi:hypothetical protein
MLPCQSVPDTRLSMVFAVVLHLYRHPSVLFSAGRASERGVHTPASAPHSPARDGPSSSSNSRLAISGGFDGSLMERGLLVRARGLHTQSLAIPCALLSRLVL